ncbi:MAG TPA: tetratricopeptide repeat protein [Polyangiaceae bacterium]|nr:tetratricopeptide repeat protein [Polyangiaceae bacterium]
MRGGGWARGALAWSVVCGGLACSAGSNSETKVVAAADTSKAASNPAALQQATQLLDASRYTEAERILRPLMGSDVELAARTQLVRVLAITGRYEEAVRTAGVSDRSPERLPEELQLPLIEALVNQGKLSEATTLAKAAATSSRAWSLKRQFAEVLLLQGRRAEATAVLQQVIDAYNEDVITDSDARAMAEVGRVAYLLRSPQDANDAFNLSEQASTTSSDQLLLWRAEMLLERHDPAQATEVLVELLTRAPNHPLALALLAQAKLFESLDLQAAEQLANRALQSNPALSQAHFVLAGVRLRDLELSAAQAQLQRGLAYNPRDLELLSLQATIAFLAGDTVSFAAMEKQILSLNREYARFYAIVAEYADWEHRYQGVVELLQRAVQVDAEEPAAHAGLGINLIRLGDESAGRAALQRAFALDPFDVRVFNTLNLFERIIDKDYESQDSGGFRFRYPRASRPVLARHVPALMTEAWRSMVQAYGFTPPTPLGVELYAEREHFAVRTSGLPNTGISGVCFGRTLAVITPHGEPLNLGMTLWHELAHVFHIELSKSRVPRWFTEGLAEYETLTRRAEWSREHDPDLYRAWYAQRLPKVSQMNRAFSHAESLHDMAVAYYASSQLVTLLAERFGRDKLRRMLQLWGQGSSDEAVFVDGLGVSSAEVDRLFDDFLRQRLARYQTQFMALGATGSSARWQSQLQRTPTDFSARLSLAVSLLEEQRHAEAAEQLQTLLRAQPQDAQVRFLKARIEETQDPKACVRTMQGLIDDGHRGYDSYLLHARCQHASGEDARASLGDAHRLDPTQSQPLIGLWQAAQAATNETEELEALRKLAKLEQHAAQVYRRLLQLLLKRGAVEEAVEVGQSAIWVDVENAELHSLYGQALRASGQLRAAEWELESARVAQ